MAGNYRLTADGVVLTSGKPQRVFGFSFKSDGGEATVTLYNGTSTSGTEFDMATAPADTVGRIAYGEQGRFFPAGCYVDMANCTYVDLDVEQVQS